MIAGASALACSKRFLTRLAPTPTNISTKSEPEIEKNGAPASPATARANSVLPVPGGPNSSTPFGIFAPMAMKRSGSARKSRISASSSMASSHPATSAKVTTGRSLSALRAFVLLKRPIGPPPPCMLVMSQRNAPTSSTTGNSWNNSWVSSDSAWLSVSTSTPASTSWVVSASA